MTTRDLADRIVNCVDTLPESEQREVLNLNGIPLAFILHSGLTDPNEHSAEPLREAMRALRARGYSV